MSIENIIISGIAVPVLWLGAFAMYMGWNKGVARQGRGQQFRRYLLGAQSSVAPHQGISNGFGQGHQSKRFNLFFRACSMVSCSWGAEASARSCSCWRCSSASASPLSAGFMKRAA